ncbi:hypothetical protein Rs2_38782 [Raphanus sativus]|nr:hypothetical protein Rs2_38782 [Raphanus sativus]
MSDYNKIDNSLNLIKETSLQTNLSTDPKFEPRSGGFVDRLAIRLGYDIPPLNTENPRSSDNYSRNLFLVPSPISVIYPGFSSLSPLLISLRLISYMMMSNNNLPHQPMDVDLPPQGCSDDIFQRKIVAETDFMNLISLESGCEDHD